MRSFKNSRAALFNAVRLGVVTVAASALSVSTAEASPILNVAGSTQGCFGAGCTTFDTLVESVATYGLTFEGTSFNVVTVDPGVATGIVLGTIARDKVDADDTLAPLPFTLQVAFSLPAGIGGAGGSSFTAFISAINNGNGQLGINFDNDWQTFNFANEWGSGSFEFGVPGDMSVNKNGDEQILGAIRNATFTSSTAPQDLTPVPEPASLLLFGMVLSAASCKLRGRRQD